MSMEDEMLKVLQEQLKVQKKIHAWVKFFGILTVISLSAGVLAGLIFLIEAM
ncbi:MAG: hypothetical protein SO063_09780 [Eubacteriales bacterium]|nr:hypothetical protein [Eubacteriales bacterium]